MKWTTVMLLSATGMLATGLAVWTVIDPAPAASPALTPQIAAHPDARTEPVVDRSHFQAGKTLMVEGRLGHRVLASSRAAPASASAQTFVFLDVSADSAALARVSAPVNLAIVVDRSGSMKGKRLKNAIAAARSSVDRLRDGDIVSIVTYNTAAEVVVAPTSIDPVSRARVRRALDQLRVGGDTCISCGIDTAMRLVGTRSGMISRILLLSDGEATAGVRDLAGFQRIAEDCRTMGASISTIGVDVDYDEKIMAALARDSNGRHFFVENTDDLPSILDREMQALTRTVATNTELTIELEPGVSVDRVFDRAAVIRGDQVVVPLGTFTADDRKTVLVRLRVIPGAAGNRPIASVGLRYDDLAEGKPGTCEGVLAAQVSDDPSQVAALDGLVSARVSGSETAEVLEQVNDLVRGGRREEAKRLLEGQSAKLAKENEKAKAAAPMSRSEDVDADFHRQRRAVEGATGTFATPPPSSAAGKRADKARVRTNQQDAFILAQ